MIFKDYYKILQLKTNRVNSHQIKEAYRQQAKLYHPDVNVGNKVNEERFKDINEAYRILSDINKKRKYDRQWYHYVGKKLEYNENKDTTSTLREDFWKMLFGKRKEAIEEKTRKPKNAIKGEDVETAIDISLEDAFYGLTKKISLRTVDGDMKSFSVKIPAGIRDNEKIRIIGQGKAGQHGGKNGDLFIKVKIEKNAKFILKGYDIETELLVTPWEAALGTKTKIMGIDDELFIDVPEGAQSGQVIIIENKGYKDGKGARGKLLVNIKIMVPHKLTEEERSIFEKLKQLSKFNPRLAG